MYRILIKTHISAFWLAVEQKTDTKKPTQKNNWRLTQGGMYRILIKTNVARFWLAVETKSNLCDQSSRSFQNSNMVPVDWYASVSGRQCLCDLASVLLLCVVCTCAESDDVVRLYFEPCFDQTTNKKMSCNWLLFEKWMFEFFEFFEFIYAFHNLAEICRLTESRWTVLRHPRVY